MSPNRERFRILRSARLPIFGSGIVLFIASILLLAPGCGEEPSPTVPNQKVENRASASRQQIAADPQVLDMLSRSVLVDPRKLEIVNREATDTGEIISMRRIGEKTPDIAEGTILVGKTFGDPREVVGITTSGGLLLLQTIPADWSPVTDAGTLTFSVPLSGGSGERDGVKWGAWTLVRKSDGKRIPMDMPGARAPSGFDPDDIAFEGFTLCAGSGGASACGNFKVDVVSGHLNLAGDFHFDLDLSLDDIVERVRAYATESIEAALVLEIEGSASIAVEGCLYGYCFDDIALVRSFEVGGMEGELELAIVIGIEGGVENIKFRPGFTLTQSLEVGVEYDADANPSVQGLFNADASFDPSLEVVSLGNGYLKIYFGPKVKAQFEILGDADALQLEAGAFAYLKGTMDRPEYGPGCDDWHIGIGAGTDARVLAKIKPVDISEGFTLTWPKPPIDLADFWGTGDLEIVTAAHGVDPDWNGYNVSAIRDDTTAAPKWTNTLEVAIGVDDEVTWFGGNCRKMPPILFDPYGILDCDLLAAEHVVEIDDVMWNCAVRGEEMRIVCLEEGEQNTVRYDVDCISVFEAMCDYVGECIESGTIRDNGVAKSLCSKLDNAGAARDRGQPMVAANVLSAFTNEIRAQTGKNIAPDAAAVLLDRARLVLTRYLGIGAGDVTTGLDDASR
jgi:hypothetical protein